MENRQERSHLSELTISSTQYINEEKYWLNKLAGEIVKSHFPYDFRNKQIGKFAAGVFRFRLGGELYAKVIKSAKGSDPRVHMILTAGLIALLYRYTRNTDIIVGTSIYKQEVEGEFVNTALALRHSLDPNMTFRDLLKQVRQTIAEANENANYPVETLLYQLNIPASSHGFPLFDVAILLENIHDKRYLQDINPNMVFTFLRRDEFIEGEVEYNDLLYTKAAVEMIAHRFEFLLEKLLAAADSEMSDIELLDEEARRRILEEFNDTACAISYPLDNPVHLIFEEQVEKTPEKAAVIGQSIGEPAGVIRELTYRELNTKANQVAHLLREKGVKPDTIVGIMVGRSLELITGILGTLKAGGAYLAVDTTYPADRKRYVLENSNVKVLLTQKDMMETEKEALKNIPAQGVLLLDDEGIYTVETSNPVSVNHPEDLVYVIYTSGSTGKPKGVLIRHRGLVNMAGYHREVFKEDHRSRMSQVASQSFDAMAFEIWPCLLSGAALFIADDGTRIDPVKMKEWLIENKITISFQPTMMAERLLREEWPDRGTALKALRAAGEALTLTNGNERSYPFRFYNLYGPTEDTIWATWTEITFDSDEKNERMPPIGKPVGNHRVYIFDRNLKLQPIGIPGELSIAGEGLARGYLNNPELTAERFLSKSYKSYRSYRTYISSKKIYKTGDLARWLMDGDIEFLGRIDQQVKIRGYRIELGEIENQLLEMGMIAEAVVIDNIAETGERYLVAYVVPDTIGPTGTSSTLKTGEIKEYLARVLPDYMIPSFFVQLDNIPLNASGKVDRKSLPEPSVMGMDELIPLNSETERRLAALMSEVLAIDKDMIGANSSFFDLGGHSLRAITLTAKIHEAFDIKVPVGEIFSLQTVRALAVYLDRFKVDTEDRYSSIEAVEAKEYYELSSAQKRLYIVQQMNPRDTSYNMPQMIPLNRAIDKKGLEDTFNALVRRHESLRTSFVIIDEEPAQRILSPGGLEFKIEYYIPANQSRGGVVEAYTRADSKPGNPGSNEKVIFLREEIIGNFVRPFNLAEAPQLRVGLIKETEERYLLMVDMHHIITDGESNDIVIKEFTALDAGLEPPELRLQYKDYAVWQNSEDRQKIIKQQETYWLEQFADGAPTLNLPTDFERPALQDFDGDFVDIVIEDECCNRLKTLAKETDTTMFMVILAFFTILLSKYSGQENIVVGTPISGRPHADLQDIIGMFVNMLPLRNVPARTKGFTEFLQEVKKNCLDAYENQDYQYDQLVDRLGLWKVVDRSPVFNVCIGFQQMNVEIGPAPDAADDVTAGSDDFGRFKTKYDLFLKCAEYKNGLQMILEYKTSLFKPSTIETITDNCIEIIKQVIEDRNIKLGDITISTRFLLVETEGKDEEVGFSF